MAETDRQGRERPGKRGQGMPAGRLLATALVLLGLILPTANAWAQG